MICSICNSEDIERVPVELEIFECDSCGNFLHKNEIIIPKQDVDYFKRIAVEKEPEETHQFNLPFM